MPSSSNYDVSVISSSPKNVHPATLISKTDMDSVKLSFALSNPGLSFTDSANNSNLMNKECKLSEDSSKNKKQIPVF